MKVCHKTCIFFFFPIINKQLCMAKRSLLSRCPSYLFSIYETVFPSLRAVLTQSVQWLGCELDGLEFKSQQGRIYLPSAECAYRLWGPPSFLLNLYLGLKRSGCEVTHFHLDPELRMGEAVTPFLLVCMWRLWRNLYL